MQPGTPRPNPGTCDDDAEFVVLSHPTTGQNGQPAPTHVHDGRIVCCKKAANEIVMEPITPQPRQIGHDSRHKYTRSEDCDAMGRAVFKSGT